LGLLGLESVEASSGRAAEDDETGPFPLTCSFGILRGPDFDYVQNEYQALFRGKLRRDKADPQGPYYTRPEFDKYYGLDNREWLDSPYPEAMRAIDAAF
jgi:hypothetical protein